METANTGGRPRRKDLFDRCATAFLASGAAVALVSLIGIPLFGVPPSL